jgi:hypothetical protein
VECSFSEVLGDLEGVSRERELMNNCKPVAVEILKALATTGSIFCFTLFLIVLLFSSEKEATSCTETSVD